MRRPSRSSDSGLTGHCRLHSVAFRAMPHVWSGEFDLCAPITRRFFHSHNSPVPGMVTAEGVSSWSWCCWAFHLDLIWSLGKANISCSLTEDREKTSLSAERVAWTHTDRCAGTVYELVYRRADLIGLRDATVPIFTQNMQSPAHLVLPSGSLCWRPLKKYFANSPADFTMS